MVIHPWGPFNFDGTELLPLFRELSFTPSSNNWVSQLFSGSLACDEHPLLQRVSVSYDPYPC